MNRWVARSLLAAIPVAAGLLIWVTPKAARAIPLFRVRRVEVRGAQYLTAQEVASALRLGAKASIFDPAGPLERRIVAMDGVVGAVVSRRIPGALLVSITERNPVALTRAGGRLALVDRFGRVLPFDPSRGPADFPIAPVDSGVTALLERIREAEPELYRKVITATRDRATVVLETAQRRLLLRVGASSREIESLAMVEAEVERRAMAVAELDGRFDGRVLARGRRA
jgi:cell division protein FtsQ